jgi:hypothetical protein
MRRLGFFMIGMLLFAAVLPFQSHAQSRTSTPPVESVRGQFSAESGGLATTPYLTETWRTGIWGTGIGVSGIIPADLDSNGSLELIMGGGSQFFGNYFWYITSYLPDSGRYEQIWMSRTYNQGFITAITTADANQDGRLEIYIALSSGMLEIYDGPTRELRATIVTGLQELADVLVAGS